MGFSGQFANCQKSQLELRKALKVFSSSTSSKRPSFISSTRSNEEKSSIWMSSKQSINCVCLHYRDTLGVPPFNQRDIIAFNLHKLLECLHYCCTFLDIYFTNIFISVAPCFSIILHQNSASSIFKNVAACVEYPFFFGFRYVTWYVIPMSYDPCDNE